MTKNCCEWVTKQLWQNSSIKSWQNSKTQIVTVVIVTLVTEAVVTLAVVTLVLTWHLESQWDVLGAAFRKSCNVILLSLF